MAVIEIDAVQENLRSVFDFVSTELDGKVTDKKLQREIKLCIEEIFLNISSYAYYPEIGMAQITVQVDEERVPNRVMFTFKDEGVPFDPLAEQDPDVDAELPDRRVGGLGIFLVKKKVDGISYEYKDGQNVLTIVKDLDEVQLT